MRVLYVDDDRVQALLFAEACRLATGIDVETVASGAEALEFAGGFDPHLLVIDLHLPDTTGIALLPRLRSALGRPAAAILCTADDERRVGAPARAAGFDDCWIKPVDTPAMVAELARRRRGCA
jgi:CheY-like chemotaxis protein